MKKDYQKFKIEIVYLKEDVLTNKSQEVILDFNKDWIEIE